MAETDAFKRIAEEKQERVFRAAANEFASNGYQKASMNSVVKEAGISKGSLFQYFPTKLDLFEKVVAVATHRAKGFLRETRNSTSGLSIDKRLGDLLKAGFDFIDKHPQLSRIYFGMLHSGSSPFGSTRLQVLHRQGIEFLTKILEEATENGELRDDLDLPRIAFLLNGVMQQLLHSYYTENLDSGLGLYRGEGDEIERWMQTAIDFIINGIINKR